MKILFVVSQLLVGGVESSLENLLKYGLNTDDEVELHFLNQKKPLTIDLPDHVKIRNIENNVSSVLGESAIHNLGLRIQSKGIEYAARKLLVSFAAHFGKNYVCLLADEMFPDKTASECDVCIVLKENEPTLYYALTRVKSKRIICYFHTARYLSKNYIDIYQSKEVKKLLTVSSGNADFLRSKMPKASNKIEVIHNIVRPNDIIEKSKDSVPDCMDWKEFNLISVCRVNEEKGVDTIIAAAKRLLSDGVVFQWYILGPFDKGYTREYWQERTKISGTDKHIIFTGAKENPYPFIRCADIFVNVSRIESFGMAIREAQILGTPVISTETDGGKELIEDGITGILIPIDDSERLAEEIQGIVENSDRLEELKANLRNRNFDELDIIKKQLRSVLGE